MRCIGRQRPKVHLQPRTYLAPGFTVGLHLPAALLWLNDVRLRPPALSQPQVVSILLTPIARTVPRPLPATASIALRTRRLAHVERTAGVQQDSYTSPGGTIVYRKRIGNRTMCRTSGNTGGGTAAGVRSGSDAGWIPCPGGVTWQRDP